MAYIKNNWVDQEVERPRTYEMTNNSDGSVTLIDSFGLVSELGTPVNADNMNHIEEGIEGCAIRKHNLTEVFEATEWVTAVVDGKKKLFESLQDNNQGHEVSEADWWEEVSLGGGGFDVCDIGFALFIDESKGLRRYLNGQIVAINSNTQGFLNKLLKIKATNPSLFTTEANWQSEKTLSDFGQVGKFVLNYASDGVTVESVRLPAVVNVQGLFDLQNLGMTVKAGLPDIKGKVGPIGADGITLEGAFYNAGKGGVLSNQGEPDITAGFEASRLNSIYGNSNTVQQEAIQYPYFIQIATGSKTEVIVNNQLEILSGAVLFEPKFSSTPLYDVQYGAKSETKSKIDYPDAYDALLVEVNPDITVGTTVNISDTFSYTKRGISVKETGASDITEYDWTVNGTNETFTSPAKSAVYPEMPSNIYLYFCIATIGQNAAIANLGRIEEKFNNYTTKNMVDGEWVILEDLILSTATAIGTYEIDLSSILPNDNFEYMLLMKTRIERTESGAGVNTQYYIKDSTLSTTWGRLEADKTYISQANNSYVVIVGSDRKFNIEIGVAKADGAVTSLMAYRRIGTNQ